MNGIIFALTANGRPFVENAKEAGTVTLLGMVAIFVVLSLLWGVIEILHKLLGGVGKKKADKAAQNTPAPAVSEVAVPEPAEESAEDDGALVAAITAAISAAMAEEGYTGGFRVVSFKRAPARRNGRA